VQRTAAFWKDKGAVLKPPPNVATFDFPGLTALVGFFSSQKPNDGSSKADAELGAGLYITDTLIVALNFANGNSAVNPGTEPAICAIFAADSAKWRESTKFSIPEALRGDSRDCKTSQQIENARQAYIELQVTIAPGTEVRTGPLADTMNQLVVPPLIAPSFEAECIVIDKKTFDPHVRPAGFPSDVPFPVRVERNCRLAREFICFI
ncbi:hypothetical protein C8R43DRAFT_904849, partial [Mycena crocata]